MSIITELFLLGTIGIIFELLTFGTLGYFLFRCFGRNEKYWYLEMFSLIALYFAIEIWYNSFFKKLNITIDNKEVLEFFENDIQSLLTFDIVDFFIISVEIGLGYLLGRLLFKRIKRNIVNNS